MDDWTYWILTSILIVVFVFQLTNFNRPWQKMDMQIENIELRHSEMQSRLSRDNDELEALQESLYCRAGNREVGSNARRHAARIQ